MDNIIPDGSLIAYEPVSDAYTLKNGDIVVYSNDYEYSVKHYYKHNDTLVFKPNSTNPIHHDQTYNIDDNITIHGKVVLDRKSTRLNSSHVAISYAVFCLK